jgi:hypothetical protein
VNQLTQEDWSEFVPFAAAAYNRAPNAVLNGHTPDEVYFGRKSRSFVDFNRIDFNQVDDSYVANYLKSMESVWEEVRLAQQKANTAMDARRKKYLHERELHPFRAGDMVIVKKREDYITKGLCPKLSHKNMGPFKVVRVQEEFNHLDIQIAPSTVITVHRDDVTPYWREGVVVNVDEAEEKEEAKKKFTPLLNEIVPELEIPDAKQYEGKKFVELDEKEKAKYDVRTIVGKRIIVKWADKKWEPGTVIGYNAALTHNLVFYDDRRDPDAEESENYFRAFLYPKGNEKKRKEVWKLIKYTD